MPRGVLMVSSRPLPGGRFGRSARFQLGQLVGTFQHGRNVAQRQRLLDGGSESQDLGFDESLHALRDPSRTVDDEQRRYGDDGVSARGGMRRLVARDGKA